MAFWRSDIQLAIPEGIYNAIPAAKKIAFRDTIRAMKALAVKINEGADNEEMTVTAQWHKCYHDEGGRPCEAAQEI